MYNDILPQSKKIDPECETLESLGKVVLEKDPFKNKIWFEIETLNYLRELFKVNNIYRLNGFYYESMNQFGLLTKTATLLHINHFGGVDKKHITSAENKNNITLMFWLFDDILVVSEQSGLRSW